MPHPARRKEHAMGSSPKQLERIINALAKLAGQPAVLVLVIFLTMKFA